MKSLDTKLAWVNHKDTKVNKMERVEDAVNINFNVAVLKDGIKRVVL